VKVDKGIKYIQVFNSGKHTLIALAFKSAISANLFLERKKNGCYSREIPLESIEAKDKEKEWDQSVASCITRFEVPQELFAKKPESKWGKLWWKYLFWPKKAKPKDECQTRKLSWFFSWMKFPIFILINILYPAYTIITSLAVLFFGFWPTNITRKILHPVEEGWSMSTLAADAKFLRIYNKYGLDTGKKMWFSPFFAVLIVLLGCLEYSNYLDNFKDSYLSFYALTLLMIGLAVPLLINKNLKAWGKDEGPAVIIGLIVFFFASLYSVIFYRAPEQALAGRITTYIISSLILVIIVFGGLFAIFQDDIEEFFEKFKKEKINKKYQDYLRQNFTKKLSKADPQELSETFDSNETGRNVYAKFWATKAQICKPYEE
jgi:hypothetical protein